MSGSRMHDHGSGAPAAEGVPEPPFAERARTLVYVARAGTLSTLSRKHPGHPFGSVMPYALDAGGSPLLLISAMAVHTQNIEEDPRASLLVAQPGWAGDPLATGRVTLVGSALPVPGDAVDEVREGYLHRHPNAAYWVDYDDFRFYRLDVADAYFVGGFAAMGWVAAGEYREARPDPLADAAEEILAHMNRDHTDAVLAFARALAGLPADEAAMTAVDRLGFKLKVRCGRRVRSARVPFPREVRTAGESREIFIEMLREIQPRVTP